MKKYQIFFPIGLIIIAIDQLTKGYIHAHFAFGESVVIWPEYFNFTYVRNLGAAFGFLADSHPEFRDIFFLLMPPLAIMYILYSLYHVRENDYWQIWGLSMIFGGAIGNYIDRLKYGFVVDFLDFHYKGIWSYPAFNVADMAIVGGVGLLLFTFWLESRALKPKLKKPIKSK